MVQLELMLRQIPLKSQLKCQKLPQLLLGTLLYLVMLYTGIQEQVHLVAFLHKLAHLHLILSESMSLEHYQHLEFTDFTMLFKMHMDGVILHQLQKLKMQRSQILQVNQLL